MPESITRSPARLKARSRLARAAQLAGSQPNAEAAAIVEDARRNYKFVTVEDYIRRTVDAAPPLTTDQKDRLAQLLHAAPAAAGDSGA